MKRKIVISAGCWAMYLALLNLSLSVAQHVELARSPATARGKRSMVLVDIVSQDPKTGLPVRDFRKEDFRVYDDGKEVPISSFDVGARYSTRPLVLWLVVPCNERGKIGGSSQFMGKESLFQPALDHLDKLDTVGVAHWCDTGDTRLDLEPTADRRRPLQVLAESLKPIHFKISGNSTLAGEITFQKMVRSIIQDAYHRNPGALPVVVFLDGDYNTRPLRELDTLVEDFLDTSGIVFGIKDIHSPVITHLRNGEQGEIFHYMAAQTGGQFLAVEPARYAAALDAIMLQMHFRYQLGFIPPRIDGKRHALKVVLSPEAREKCKNVRLRSRPEYIAAPLPAWTR